jgi:hypothetical protein
MENTLENTLEWQTKKHDDEHITHDATWGEKAFRIFERWDECDEVWEWKLVLWIDDVEDWIEDEIFGDLDDAKDEAEAWKTMDVVYTYNDGWHLVGGS